MKYIEYIVKNMQIYKNAADKSFITSGAVNHYGVRFEFDEDMLAVAGTKVCEFFKDRQTIKREIVDGYCTIPNEMLEDTKPFEMRVVCGNTVGTMWHQVKIVESGSIRPEEPDEAAPAGTDYIKTPQGDSAISMFREADGAVEYSKNGSEWEMLGGNVSNEYIEQIVDAQVNTYLTKSDYATAIAFGTSITYRCQDESAKGGYMQIINEGLGLNSYVNAGYDGNPFAYGSANGDGISYKIQNTDISDYDLITIEGGTNDFKLNIELGDVGKMGDTNFDNTTTCGALRQAIEYIYTNNPTAKIVLITDPQRNNANYDVNYINSAGYKLIDYITAIIKIGQMYGIPVCDWYHLSGFNNFTLSVYTSDGLHPNALGHEVLGKIALSAIKNTPNIFIIECDDKTDIETVNINGVEYNISVAQGYTYKMIMILGSNYYMYASNQPLFVYDDTKYSETFYKDTVRYSLTDNVFGTPAIMIDYPDTTIQIENTEYYYMKMSRELSSYLWTNHDLKYYSNGEVAIKNE